MRIRLQYISSFERKFCSDDLIKNLNKFVIRGKDITKNSYKIDPS